MAQTIRKAVVIGSGVMGAGIAAHLANAGLQIWMLDQVPEDAAASDRPAERNRFGLAALDRLRRQKPSPVFTPEVLERIRIGNLEDDLGRVAEADWVIEAVTERLDIKRALLARIEAYWKPGTIVSSNTSGISIGRMLEGRSEAFARQALVTHFFNPPRYMKLLELVPGPLTEPAALERVEAFAEERLGKGVVRAKDTPNFIANRIGAYGLLVALREKERFGLSFSDVDALTGPLLGRPKSATFRTLDLVGLDTFLHVAANVRNHAADEAEKAVFTVPPLIEQLVAQGALGEKAGRGFYQAVRGEQGTDILEWSPSEGGYIKPVKRKFASVDAARNAKTPFDRLRALVYGDDPGGRFVWAVLKKTLLYAASKLAEIADSVEAVDNAMKWGFHWEHGPFELWDAIGVERSVVQMEKEGETIPAWLRAMLAEGRTAFYRSEHGGAQYADPDGGWKARRMREGVLSLAALKGQGRVIRQNGGARLIDLGDEVACLEFCSPNHAIGPDILQMIDASLVEVRANYRGLVLGNEGKNFCVGANLMMLLVEAQDQNWPDIDRLIRRFHRVAMSMKYFEKPIVAAPFAMTLGGGVEMCLPAARVQAAAETYMGLVETGVGLIPAGGGTKEMLVRHTVPVDFDGKVDLQPFVNRVFETIGMGKVSTSAPEAMALGYLRPGDRYTMNADRLIADAKRAVLALSLAGYEPPEPPKVRVVGAPGLAVMRLGVYQLLCGGRISEHDAKIAGKLAAVLAGGSVPANTQVSEEALLELEREAFLSLCGEPKTQARMQHMLLKGKPLRN